ncbi:MAG TPA: pilus assembly protein N-terminal domain-containing protein [Vicinamibacterales bacterium]|nr:pilus assembly protein N-terminal domain-containing protein [Vicinamibacterales bacterium]
MRITGRAARTFFILLIAVAAPGVIFADDSTPSVRLTVGRSAIVDLGAPIARVSLTSADIADAMVTSSNQLLVNGKLPGTISMFVWERNGALRQFEVVVQRDLNLLNEQIKRLFPGESIDAQSNGKSIVLSGMVSNKDLADKARTVAAGYVDKPDDVVNMLKVQESTTANQVLLRVRFAEVSRSAVTELGASFFTSPLGIKNTLARTTTQQFGAPGFDGLQWTKSSSNFGSDVTSAEGKFTFSDFLNLFLFSEKYDIGTMIKALSTRGMFQSLAEPNLVAETGKEASFLAGGEFPVPIAQGTGGNVAISVSYKEFGIRLNFVPVINGNRVHLKVRPEVSTLDFANGVVLQGFRIPALSTRRTETEIELNDGQTFAIAGLLNNSMNSTLQKIPGIGDIPVLGLLFKSKAAQKDQTELVVMITPQILQRTSPGVTSSLPRTPEPFLPPMPENKTVNPPAPAFSPERPSFSVPSPSSSAANPLRRSSNDNSSRPATKASNSPAEAAAVVSSLTPASHAQGVVSAPAAAPATDAAAPAQPVGAPRPMTSDEKRALERVQRADGEAKAREEEALRKATKAEQERQKAEAEHQGKLAKEKEKEDREKAKVAATEAKRQAEIQKNHQKALDEAAAKAKEAQAKYEALAAKGQKQQ